MRRMPHPFGPYRQPLHFDAARWAGLPRCLIDCMAPAYPTIAPMRQRVRQMAGFEIIEMATGHCPMVSAPGALVEHLLALAGR